MIPKKIRFNPVRTEPVLLSTGLNENSSSMEMRGGDITDGYNYYIKDGTFGGYTSTEGYERYDGRLSPTETPYKVLEVSLIETVSAGDTVIGGSGSATVAGQVGNDLILINDTGTFHVGNIYVPPLTEMLDTLEMEDALVLIGDAVGTCNGPQVESNLIHRDKRQVYAAIVADYVRNSISQVPGSGAIRGLYFFKGSLYAFRDKIGGLSAGMYKESSLGWVEVTTLGISLVAGGVYKFIEHNFYAGSDTLYMYWVNGVDTAYYFNGTAIVKIVNAGMGANDKPTSIAAHNDRLFLAYSGASLQYSVAGDPTDFTDGAGEIGLGHEITEISPILGNTLVIFCKDKIKLLNGYISNDPDSDWTLEDYSNEVGGKSRTVVELIGSLIFVDDKGVTSLSAAQEFGNFKSNALSQKVFKTFEKFRGLVTCSVVHRDYNQYRLFFNNKYSLYFTFTGGRLKGATVIKFPLAVYCVTNGDDTSDGFVSFFSSTDGMVYKMDTGTSFDGEEIMTKMQSSFYHYKNPRNWKRFKRVTFELASASEVSFNFRFLFDYASGTVPRSVPYEVETYAADDRYGEAEYGTSVYSSGFGTSQVGFNLRGVGTNMSTILTTSSSEAKQHTIQAFVTDFQLSGRQL